MKLYRKSPRLAHRVICGRAYIVDAKESLLHELNETGTFLWNLLEPPGSGRSELAAGLAREFEVPRTRADRDAREFISRLVKLGLAEEADG